MPARLKAMLVRFHRYYSYGCVVLATGALLVVWLSEAGSCCISDVPVVSPDVGWLRLGHWLPVIVGMGIFGFPVVRLLIILGWTLSPGPHTTRKWPQVCLLVLPLLSLTMYGIIVHLGG